jgi:sugar/nucleoside kinase (ribokinase family)
LTPPAACAKDRPFPSWKAFFMSQKIDVLGLGNALIDIIASADDAYLVGQDMAKGAMTLIDEDRADALYAVRQEPKIVSGGSAANTIVGVASFGVSAAYIGKVKQDELGHRFGADLNATGVSYATSMAAHGPGTGRCFVYVTPDGERTMNTFLGASSHLSPDDVDEALVRSARFVYLEGYMWDRPAAKEAFRKAGRIAHEAGARVALTLSDAFCVDRFRGEFIDLMRTGIVDTVFANSDEARSLYQTPHLNEALDALAAEGVHGVVTRSELGSVIVEGDKRTEVPAYAIARLVDTTGAGDLFASGYLAGLARGHEPEHCARLAALAASEVIQHIGARPEVSLRELAAQAGLAI